MDGFWSAVTVSVSSGEVTGSPFGSVPVASAMFVTDPALRSSGIAGCTCH